MNDSYITIIFTLIGFFVFSFIFWRDATKEGYSSDKIFDSIFLMIIFGVIGGKILFRPLTLDFFRYQFLNAPLVLEGVLIGVALAAYLVINRHKWDPWKIGDMIAPAITIFQAILFLGYWYRTGIDDFIIISILFWFLYYLIIILRKKMFIGSNLEYSFLKRLNKPIFSGGLLTTYLTGSSLIAILFLSINVNQDNWFWWFQLIFYLFILISTLFLVSRRVKKEDIKVSSYLPKDFVDEVLQKLKLRKKKIVNEQRKLNDKDPFIQEFKDEGSRNLDSIEEEAADTYEHVTLEAEAGELQEEAKSIDMAINQITEGTYGMCQNCGAQIDKARLEA